MRVVLKNYAQRRRFEVLFERTISPNHYPDFPMLIALGLTDSVRFMFTQMSWDRFSVAKHPTYRNLTLESLALLTTDLTLDQHQPQAQFPLDYLEGTIALTKVSQPAYQHSSMTLMSIMRYPPMMTCSLSSTTSGVGLQKITRMSILE